MSDDSERMTCDGFADQLAGYLEDEISEPTRLELEAHAASCAACGALLMDLGAIRREAALLPPLEPSRDLWDGIAERIDAPVLPLQARPVAGRRAWMRPAVAAAALILVTAGITHVLTRASYAPTATSAAGGSPPTQIARAQGVTGVQPAESSAPDARITSTATSESAPRSAERGPDEVRSSRTGGAAVATLVGGRAAAPAVPHLYDREIGTLRRIVNERRSQLDPATIAVLERSIAVIDSAIAQSDSALRQDPASGFLATQLNQSLEKKVELLRLAASLPSRT